MYAHGRVPSNMLGWECVKPGSVWATGSVISAQAQGRRASSRLCAVLGEEIGVCDVPKWSSSLLLLLTEKQVLSQLLWLWCLSGSSCNVWWVICSTRNSLSTSMALATRECGVETLHLWVPKERSMGGFWAGGICPGSAVRALGASKVPPPYTVREAPPGAQG